MVLLPQPIKPATESRRLPFMLPFIGWGPLEMRFKSKDGLAVLKQRNRKPDNVESNLGADAFICSRR